MSCSPDKYGVHISFQILIRTRATDLDSRMYDGSTALILAARLAVEGMVEELITCHADVNAVDELGKYTLVRKNAVSTVFIYCIVYSIQVF